MAVLQTPAEAPSATRVSHALNAMLAVVLGVLAVAAVTYRIAVGMPSPGNPYLVLALGCGTLLACTAVAEVGFHTTHRWARAGTCIAWLGAWPVLFVALTLMVVDGAAATLAFIMCIGACSVGIDAIGETTTAHDAGRGERVGV